MAQRNDDELAFYLAQLTNPNGQISDQERLWYLTELNIAQPYLGATQMNDLWMAYWLTKGIPQGSVNDMAYNWLVSIGIPARHINDMWHDYFDSGITYPPILNTALVWLDNTTILDTTGAVTSWNNKGTGGSAYDMSSASGPPSVTTENGLRAVMFDGNNDHLRAPTSVLISQPFTVHMIARALTIPTVQNEHFYSGDPVPGANLHFVGINNAQQNYQFHAGGNLLTPQPSADLNLHLFSAEVDNLNSSYYVSGIQVKTSGGMGSNSWDYQVLGSGRGLTVADHLNCIICEQIILPGIQTSQEYIDIQNYLITKWIP